MARNSEERVGSPNMQKKMHPRVRVHFFVKLKYS